MYNFVSLSEAKKHLNIDDSFTDDDTYISGLTEVATIAIENHLNYSLSGYTGSTLPVNIKHAILLIVGNLYANREPVSFGTIVNQIPYTLNYLIDSISTRVIA